MLVVIAALSAIVATSALSSKDLRRAYQPKPHADSHVISPHPVGAWEAMNTHLLGQDVTTFPCEGLDHDQLNDVARQIWSSSDPSFNQIYKNKNDKRAFHFDSLEYKEKLWKQEGATLKPATSEYGMVRDGKCAEVVMWWVHHLTESTKSKLSQAHSFVLPLMPQRGPVATDNKEYIYQVQCSDCHTTGHGNNKTATTSPGPGSVLGRKRITGLTEGNATCPINPKTGLPTVFYKPMKDVGNRKKRCDWDYDPPCQPCEGIGGLIWGDQEHQIDYTSCELVDYPIDIPKGNLTNPLWPKTFTVHEDTILVDQGRFPGADPCAKHSFKNQTETQWFDTSGPYSHIHTFGLLDTADIWAMPNANMYIKIENTFCICVTPRENGAGSVPIGPLRYDFNSDAVLVGRELIGVEFLDRKVVADHWNKGPHHFWIEVTTNKMIRAWQPYNGLNVYSKWNFSKPAMKDLVVTPSCYSGFPPLHKNISCVGAYPGN